ncbi:MAG TPA: hypothetical protein VII23_00880, partial [Terriglobales bacterium]
AATRGHRVSLADFFVGTEDETVEAALFGVKAGTLATANFDGCLPYHYLPASQSPARRKTSL